MHRTTRAAVLGAVAIAAALGLGGCGEESTNHPAATEETLPPITKPPTVAPSETSPTMAPLPPPTALTEVMYKLADPNVPGADKVGLVEYGTADDAAAADGFSRALRDGGFTPVTIEASDMKWSLGDPGNVVAFIVIKTANPQAGEAGDFTFPMEFSPAPNTWQLTRQTADLLLQLGQEPAPTPTP